MAVMENLKVNRLEKAKTTFSELAHWFKWTLIISVVFFVAYSITNTLSELKGMDVSAKIEITNKVKVIDFYSPVVAQGN